VFYKAWGEQGRFQRGSDVLWEAPLLFHLKKLARGVRRYVTHRGHGHKDLNDPVDVKFFAKLY
jgi:hypothetical protein